MKKRGHATINRILSCFNESEVNVYLGFGSYARNRYTIYLAVSHRNNFKPSRPSEWIEKKELMSYTQIGKILNLSTKEVKEIEQTALRKMKNALLA